MTRFEAPSWLSQSAWDLRITHSTSGWQINLKPYCVRPLNDEVFEHARNGNTQALGELIRSGEASIHDIDEEGGNFLYVSTHELLLSGSDADSSIQSACLYSQVELVEQLLLWGADITLRDFVSHKTPVHAALALYVYTERDLMMWPAMDHLLTSIGAYEDIEDVKPWRPGSHQGMIDDNECRDMTQSVKFFKFFQPVFSPNHHELGIYERLDHCRVRWEHEDDVLRYLLFKEGTVTSEQIQALENRGVGPLNLVAYGYEYYYTHNTMNSELRVLVRDLVKLGADLHFEQHPHALPQHMRGVKGYPYSTPFFGVLIPGQNFFSTQCAEELQERMIWGMMSWLEDLQMCGIDLQRYGKIEKKMFRNNKILRERWYPWDQWMQLSDFAYGPEPENWILEWDLMTERYVGDFWAMIEEQMRNPQLPGTWVDSVPDIRWFDVGYRDPCED